MGVDGAGVAGAPLGSWLCVPAGALFGPFLAVGAWNLFAGQLQTPPTSLQWAGQVLIGVFLGFGVSRTSVALMRDIALRALVSVVALVSTGFVPGFLLTRLGPST